MSKRQVTFELFAFLAAERKYWLMPVTLALVLIGIFIAVSQSSAASAFLYSLF